MSTLTRTRRTYERTRQDIVRTGRHRLAGGPPNGGGAPPSGGGPPPASHATSPRQVASLVRVWRRRTSSRSSSLCGEWGFKPPFGHHLLARQPFPERRSCATHLRSEALGGRGEGSLHRVARRPGPSSRPSRPYSEPTSGRFPRKWPALELGGTVSSDLPCGGRRGLNGCL